MRKLTTEELKEYLKHATEMEVNLHKMQRAYDTALEKMFSGNKNTVLVDDLKSELISLEEKQPPEPPKKKEAPASFSWSLIEDGAVGWITFGCLLCALLFSVFFLFEHGKTIGWIFLIICLCAPFVIEAFMFGTAYYEYKTAGETLERQHNEALKRHAEEVEKWRKQTEKRKQEIKAEIERIRPAEEKRNEKLSLLSKGAHETKQSLAAFYANGVLHKKYQNLVAVCQLYEYIDTGRCTELEGPSGAYNLFESEMRQNFIILSLQTIIFQLASIQINQYYLYKRLNEVDKAVRTLSLQAASTSESAMISQHYSKVAAENAEAMKYLTLLK